MGGFLQSRGVMGVGVTKLFDVIVLAGFVVVFPAMVLLGIGCFHPEIAVKVGKWWVCLAFPGMGVLYILMYVFDAIQGSARKFGKNYLEYKGDEK